MFIVLNKTYWLVLHLELKWALTPYLSASSANKKVSTVSKEDKEAERNPRCYSVKTGASKKYNVADVSVGHVNKSVKKKKTHPSECAKLPIIRKELKLS